MNVLVFGGTGLIGSAISKELSDAEHDTIPYDKTCDITSCDLGKLFSKREPSVVINAAWPKSNHLMGFASVMEKAVGYWIGCGVKGCLISIASIYATLPPRFELYPTGMGKDPDYVASKAAIVQLTRYWARKARGSGIRVNCVSPGGVYRDEPSEFVARYSKHTNHGGMLPAEAVAQACRFLVDCPWVTGQNLVVADGFDL